MSQAQSNAQWMQMLAEQQNAFAAAEEFNDWMPPAGTYSVLVTKERDGVWTDKKVTPTKSYPYWSLTAQLLDGVDGDGNDLAGQEFDLGMFSLKVPGILKGAARVLNGAPVDDLMAVDSVMKSAIGKCLRVEVKPSAKSPGRMNVNIRELIPQAPADPAPAPAAAPTA